MSAGSLLTGGPISPLAGIPVVVSPALRLVNGFRWFLVTRSEIAWSTDEGGAVAQYPSERVLKAFGRVPCLWVSSDHVLGGLVDELNGARRRTTRAG